MLQQLSPKTHCGRDSLSLQVCRERCSAKPCIQKVCYCLSLGVGILSKRRAPARKGSDPDCLQAHTAPPKGVGIWCAAPLFHNYKADLVLTLTYFLQLPIQHSSSLPLRPQSPESFGERVLDQLLETVCRNPDERHGWQHTSSHVSWKLFLAFKPSKYSQILAYFGPVNTSYAFSPSPSLYAPISFFNATSILAKNGRTAASAIVKSFPTANLPPSFTINAWRSSYALNSALGLSPRATKPIHDGPILVLTASMKKRALARATGSLGRRVELG